MAFLSNLLTLGDLPVSPRFPSLSMILYWDFYNYPCLLHPYQKGPYVVLSAMSLLTKGTSLPCLFPDMSQLVIQEGSLGELAMSDCPGEQDSDSEVSSRRLFPLRCRYYLSDS